MDVGVSPRAGLALLELARAGAMLEGMDFVSPDQVKQFLTPCWAHRMLLSAESELEGITTSRVLRDAATSVEVPR